MRPPEEQPDLVFFVDRALGSRRVAEALRHAGERVEVHDDHFPPDTLDTVWIPEVGRRSWVVLTKDKRLRSRTTELLAIRHAGLRVFTLPAGNMTGAAMGAAFAEAREAMKRLVPHEPAPFLARVYRGGTVRIGLSADDLRKAADSSIG